MTDIAAIAVIGGGGGGGVGAVQLHFCTWPPDFCQMYCTCTKCTKMYKICFFLFGSSLDIDLLAVANLQ